MYDMVKLLPDAGPGRWWRVEVIKQQATNPMKVSLMEDYNENSRGPSVVLAHRRTIAQKDKVIETAQRILDEVGDYAALIGDYPSVNKPRPGWAVVTRGQRSTAHYFKEGEIKSVCATAVSRNAEREVDNGVRSPIDCTLCAVRVVA